jgi:RNA polymerase sigma factor (sigma-70 family)
MAVPSMGRSAKRRDGHGGGGPAIVLQGRVSRIGAPFAVPPRIENVVTAVPSPPAARRPPSDAARIAERHERALRRYLRVLGAGSDLDDLVQETFLVLLQRDFVDEGPAPTAAFLRRTARHLFLRRHRGLLPQVEAADVVWQQECGDDDGEGWVEALRYCLQRLPRRAARIVQASYGEDLGRAAIAQELGMTADGVKTALRRIRSRLAECIERRRAR